MASLPASVPISPPALPTSPRVRCNPARSWYRVDRKYNNATAQSQSPAPRCNAPLCCNNHSKRQYLPLRGGNSSPACLRKNRSQGSKLLPAVLQSPAQGPVQHNFFARYPAGSRFSSEFFGLLIPKVIDRGSVKTHSARPPRTCGCWSKHNQAPACWSGEYPIPIPPCARARLYTAGSRSTHRWAAARRARHPSESAPTYPQMAFAELCPAGVS